MSAPGTIPSATRRFVALTALRWLPVGLTAPVTVLLAQERGLSLAQVGLLFSLHSLLVIVLELPTGGLADVLGRRAVVVIGAVLHLLSCVVFAVAQDLTTFCVAIVLLAVGRALDSGPLEAWYVDTVHGLDARADVAPGLAKHSAADGGGLAVGAVVGGLLPGLLGDGGAAALALPYLASAALDVVYVAAVLRLMSEARPPRTGTVTAELATGARAVPATVAAVVRLSVTDRALRLVLLLTAVGGVALVAFELLGPDRFAELAGGPEEGAAVLGTVLAASFAAAAVGALLAPSLRRGLRGSTRAACLLLTVLVAAGIGGFAGAQGLVLAAIAFGTYYVAHGATWPLLSAVLHRRVRAAERATAVSAMSLAMGLGGISGNLLLAPLADAAGRDAADAVVAAVVLLSALLCVGLPTSAGGATPHEEGLLDQPAHHGHDLLGGLALGQPGAGGQHADQLPQTAGPVAAGEQRRAVDVDPA